MKKIFSKKTNIAYFSVFVAVVALGATGLSASNTKKTDEVNSVSDVKSTSISKTDDKTSVVNDVVESNVVAGLAESANLAIAPSTANLSVSMAVLQDSPQAAGPAVEKPKILEVTTKDRKIETYKTTAEETIQSIADKYGITAQTVKWVNNLKGDTVEAGKELKILPVDGILYTVKSGDKVEDIASKYQASVERIVSYNALDEETKAVKEGQEIVIPGGILPEEERPDYVKKTSTSTSTASSSSSSSFSTGVIATSVPSSNYNVKAGNAYAWGNCTWYVYNKRPDIGSFWGNASSWAVSARSAGYRVDSTPAVGAIAQWNAYSSGASGWGHVGYVESVNSDGTITISEMNYQGAFGRVTTRTISASAVSNYIH